MKYFTFLGVLGFVFLQNCLAMVEEQKDLIPSQRVWSIEDGIKKLEVLKTERFCVSVDVRNLGQHEKWNDFPCTYWKHLSTKIGNSDCLKSTPADLYDSLYNSFSYIENGIVIAGCAIRPD